MNTQGPTADEGVVNPTPANRSPAARAARRGTLAVLLVFAGFAVAANLYVDHAIGRQQYVYFWDYATHWTLWMDYAELLHASPRHALRALLHSIDADVYNYVPAAPIAFTARLFGPSLRTYTLSILNAYLLPFVLCFVLFFARHVGAGKGEERWRGGFLCVLTALVFCYDPLYVPVLYGWACAIGLLLMLAILQLCTRHYFLRLDVPRSILLGVLILALAFARRWYAFWVVGFFVALGAASLLTALAEPAHRPVPWRAFLGNMLVAGGVCALVTLIGFRGYLFRGLLVNYADIYSAYNRYGVWGNVASLCRFLGVTYLGLAVLGLVWALHAGTQRERFLAVLFAVHFVVTAPLLCRTQHPEPSHRYLFVVDVLFLNGLFLYYVWRRASVGVRTAVTSLVLLFAAANALHVYGPRSYPWVERLAPILSRQRYQPLMRSDLPAVRQLADVLRELSGPGGTQRVCVLASSLTLNGDLLKHADFPRTRDYLPGVQTTCDVDKRDGFPNHFFLARWVVVGQPVQCHLRPADQQVIGVLADALLKGEQVGRCYREVRRFELEQGVEAVVYEKTGACDRAAADWLAGVFRRLYPDYPSLQVNPLLPLLEAYHLGKRAGEIRSVEGASVFIQPGDGEATTFTACLNKQYRRLRCVATFDNLKVLRERPADNGEVDVTLRADGRVVVERYLTARGDPLDVDLDLENVERLQIEVGPGRFGPAADWFLLKGIQLR